MFKNSHTLTQDTEIMSHDAHITYNDLTLPMGHFTSPNVMSKIKFI